MGEVADVSDDAGQAAVERQSLTAKVYEQLTDLLIRGELRPGDVITERRMAEQLNASRTPIREALGRLEAEGLVFKQPTRGVTVSPFSTEAFVDILNVRQLLEAEAARLAAGNIPKPRLDEIRTTLSRIAAARQPTLSEIWEADDLLHGEIADAAGNVLMASLIRDLRRRTHVFNAYRNMTSYRVAAEDDNRLLDALESGDGERARAAMADHIEAVKVAIIKRLTGGAR
ncbi:DNA-binding transcriptional regulator, GntR family [Faunimonas pinastri]|uniref:DNA-binding transcriptional regulator, GntR family n=1 Tax=Faunimonas pinastri TaxID=1855383 RepID=A0A1H9EQ00_9HYPH|nr:GntR family transcriptional regulator [Faunimonas pinastri]SEQ27293.1 DNA-binding transcriptional regulator, GntR family [Faunimonas pinastri]